MIYENYEALFILITQLKKEGYVAYFDAGLSRGSKEKWYHFGIDFTVNDSYDDSEPIDTVYATEDGFFIEPRIVDENFYNRDKWPTRSLKEVAEYIIKLKKEGLR